MSSRVANVEQDNLEKYSGKFYHADTITALPSPDSRIHADVVLRIRINSAAKYAENGNVLDLCCGTGEHLISMAGLFKQGIGFDYSIPFIGRALQTKATCGLQNVEFVEGNAKSLPFPNNYFDLIYSFSALYHIPQVEKVIFEISRVLKPGGKCVLDLGNLYSLNTVVCHAYPELAQPCHISVRDMNRFLVDNKLVILEHRAFQILPLWADRPWWLKPVLSPRLTRLLEKKYKGKMLDEWISNLPVFNSLAFRHVFVCEKS